MMSSCHIMHAALRTVSLPRGYLVEEIREHVRVRSDRISADVERRDSPLRDDSQVIDGASALCVWSSLVTAHLAVVESLARNKERKETLEEHYVVQPCSDQTRPDVTSSQEV